jgi:hypothetical protein
MNASELRLNNLIEYDGNPMCLDTNYTLFVALVKISRDNKQYQTILLTEEWLLMFGFDKTSLHYFKKDGIIIQAEDDYFECFLGSVVVKLQYVHQLQNLYFALTGKELIIQKNNDKSNS